MSDEQAITGVVSDYLVKDHMAEYAKDLSPAQDNDGRLAYASLLLSWVCEGETQNARYIRVKSIRQAHRNHMSDRCEGINFGPKIDTTISYPDFMAEIQKFLEFLS